MNIIQTISIETWSIQSNVVKYGGATYCDGCNLVITINPSLPYIYLSDDGWNKTTG
jgi:hypothetical protein